MVKCRGVGWGGGDLFVSCENTNQDMEAYGGGYKDISSVSSHWFGTVTHCEIRSKAIREKAQMYD